MGYPVKWELWAGRVGLCVNTVEEGTGRTGCPKKVKHLGVDWGLQAGRSSFLLGAEWRGDAACVGLSSVYPLAPVQEEGPEHP